jgi:hypothetical protein
MSEGVDDGMGWMRHEPARADNLLTAVAAGRASPGVGWMQNA